MGTTWLPSCSQLLDFMSGNAPMFCTLQSFLLSFRLGSDRPLCEPASEWLQHILSWYPRAYAIGRAYRACRPAYLGSVPACSVPRRGPAHPAARQAECHRP